MDATRLRTIEQSEEFLRSTPEGAFTAHGPGGAADNRRYEPISLVLARFVVGSVVALRQQRLKLLVAYSTVAQIGFLFLLFPLAFGGYTCNTAEGGGISATVTRQLVTAGLGSRRAFRLSTTRRSTPV